MTNGSEAASRTIEATKLGVGATTATCLLAMIFYTLPSFQNTIEKLMMGFANAEAQMRNHFSETIEKREDRVETRFQSTLREQQVLTKTLQDQTLILRETQQFLENMQNTDEAQTRAIETNQATLQKLLERNTSSEINRAKRSSLATGLPVQLCFPPRTVAERSAGHSNGPPISPSNGPPGTRTVRPWCLPDQDRSWRTAAESALHALPPCTHSLPARTPSPAPTNKFVLSLSKIIQYDLLTIRYGMLPYGS